jgi:hypothetical protein
MALGNDAAKGMQDACAEQAKGPVAMAPGPLCFDVGGPLLRGGRSLLRGLRLRRCRLVRNPATLHAPVSTGIDFNRALRSLRGCRDFLIGTELVGSEILVSETV